MGIEINKIAEDIERVQGSVQELRYDDLLKTFFDNIITQLNKSILLGEFYNLNLAQTTKIQELIETKISSLNNNVVSEIATATATAAEASIKIEEAENVIKTAKKEIEDARTKAKKTKALKTLQDAKAIIKKEKIVIINNEVRKVKGELLKIKRILAFSQNVIPLFFKHYYSLLNYCDVNEHTKTNQTSIDLLKEVEDDALTFFKDIPNDVLLHQNYNSKSIEIFLYNILTAKIDNDLSCNDISIRTLEKIEKKITNLNITDDIHNKVLYKCKMLLYKIEVRKLKNKQLELKSSSIENENGVEVEWTTRMKNLYDELNNKDENPFYNFFLKVNSMYLEFEPYFDTFEEQEYHDLIKIEKNTERENPYYYLHYLSKKYRKNGQVKKQNKINKKYLELHKNVDSSNMSDFDDKAYKYMKMFYHLQQFRTDVRLKMNEINSVSNLVSVKVDLEEIKRQYNTLVKESDDKNVLSYKIINCYHKYLNSIIVNISNRLTNNNNNNEVLSENDKNQLYNLINDVRSVFNTTYTETVKRINWAEKTDYLPIYLPYKYCIEDGCFLDSSYHIPIDFGFEKRYFEKNREELKENLSKLQFELNHLEYSTSDAKIKTFIRDNQYDSIRIIAIFSALITFVTTTVTKYKNNTMVLSGDETLKLFIALVGGFSIFSVLLSFLFEKKGEKYGWVSYVIIFLLIALVVIFLFKD